MPGTFQRRFAKSAASHRLGFSMIELLVVIGILVLLVSILLPTVSAARYKARLTTCVSNLRQISIAVNAFAIEHEGKFPTLDMPSTGAQSLGRAFRVLRRSQEAGCAALGVHLPRRAPGT